MYSNPSDIRTHEVKVRLNDKEYALLDAIADYSGYQKATLIRDILMEQITAMAAGQRVENHKAAL